MRGRQFTLALSLLFLCTVSCARPLHLAGLKLLYPGARPDQLHEHIQLRLEQLAPQKTLYVMQVGSSSLQDAEEWTQQLIRQNISSFLLVTRDTVAQTWFLEKHPGHATPINTIAHLLDPFNRYPTKVAAMSESCTRPLLISALLNQGFDVIWTEPSQVSQRIPADAVPGMHLADYSRPPIQLLPDSTSSRSNATCTCLMKLTAEDKRSMVSSLMREGEQQCLLPEKGSSSLLYLGDVLRLSVRTPCHSDDFDLPYYQSSMDLSNKGPLQISNLTAPSWWCPKCNVLCNLCSEL